MKRLALGALLVLAGCSGLIGDGGESRGGVDGSGTEGEGVSCEGVCLGTSGMMRLTRDEYAYSVRAVFGEQVVVDDKRLPADQTAGPFDANDTPVTEIGVADYSAVAWDIAEQVSPEIAGQCDATTCADFIVDSYGERLLRRPLTDAEVVDYRALFDWSVGEDGVQDAVALVVATLVSSPSFLYRVEWTDGDEPTKLTGLELATRLSLFLWFEGPDDALRQAAMSGDLDTPEGLAEHAARMMADPRGARAVAHFHRQWLDLNHIAAAEPLATQMREETEGAALQVFERGGTLTDLLTVGSAPVGEDLAAHYGVSSGANVEVPGHHGILTHASVMSNFTSTTYTRPVRRGDMLMSRVLCHNLGEPPADALDMADDEAEQLEDDMSDREKLSIVTGKPACEGCHAVLNPAGYLFESYGPDGRFRSADQWGNAIDDSGSIAGIGALDGAYEGPSELLEALAESDQVKSCMSEHWVSYALRRYVSAEDRDSVALVKPDGALEDMLVAIVKTDAFRYRIAR